MLREDFRARGKPEPGGSDLKHETRSARGSCEHGERCLAVLAAVRSR